MSRRGPDYARRDQEALDLLLAARSVSDRCEAAVWAMLEDGLATYAGDELRRVQRLVLAAASGARVKIGPRAVRRAGVLREVQE